MKKNTLDLKSALYKQNHDTSKSPTFNRNLRSPNTPRNSKPSPSSRYGRPSPSPRYDHNSAGVMTYQNICCPNCRYVFRAPKEEIIIRALDTPKNNLLTPKSLVAANRTVETQTDDVYTAHKSTPKR